MRTGVILLCTAVLLLVAGGFDSVGGQNPNRASPIPIGKVVSATGTVTIEHTGAVVVQANVSNQTKPGDLVYRGDVVSTGTDGRIGIETRKLPPRSTGAGLPGSSKATDAEKLTLRPRELFRVISQKNSPATA